MTTQKQLEAMMEADLRMTLTGELCPRDTSSDARRWADLMSQPPAIPLTKLAGFSVHRDSSRKS